MVKRILKVFGVLLLAVTLGCGDGPDAPENLNGVAAADSAVLSWDPVESGAETVTYNVYRGTASGSINGKTRIATGLGATTYTDSSLTTGATFYYQVTAQSSKGESDASNEARVTVGNLSAPANLTATAVAGQVNLTWNAVQGATGYNVYRGTTETGTVSGKSKIAAGVPATGYTDAAVTRGTIYYYQVTAIDSSRESAGSNEAGVTP